MERLISMTDFVLDGQETADYIKLYNGCFKYAKFLSQKLELWMFIPSKLINGVWVVLEEPNINDFKSKHFCESGECKAYFDELKEYQEAKDRVLFEGFKQNIYNETGSFEIVNDKGFQICVYKALPKYFLWLGCTEERTVESAIYFNVLVLTESAKKQIGL